MGDRYVVTRTVTTDECPWLDHDIKVGTKVVSKEDIYDCSSTGILYSLEGSNGGFELPNNAVKLADKLMN